MMYISIEFARFLRKRCLIKIFHAFGALRSWNTRVYLVMSGTLPLFFVGLVGLFSPLIGMAFSP